MGKGGRSHGRSHGHSRSGGHTFGGGIGHSHHHHGGGIHRSGGNLHHHRHFTHHTHHSHHRARRAGPTYGDVFDAISNINQAPTLLNGVYRLQGNQINVISRMKEPLSLVTVPNDQFENSTAMSQTVQMQMYTPQAMVRPQGQWQSQVVTEANIAVVGNKTSSGNQCCLIMTLFLGFLIFPIFFMCCMWWKKIVNPFYSLAPEFYQALGTFLIRQRQCRMLNLVVFDNTFNAEKARILHESLAKSSLTGFTFTNGVLPCNYLQNEADQFIANVTRLKSLPFPIQIAWDDMIL